MILGSDAFVDQVLTLDFRGEILEVSEQPPGRLQEGVVMVLDNGIPTIGAEIAGIDLSLRIDTGASLFETPDVYVNIPTPIWKALRVRLPALAPSTHFQGIGANGEEVALPVAPIREARIGPMELDSVYVIVQPEVGYFADPTAKGFVSNNFLQKLGRVSLDYRAERLRPGGAREVEGSRSPDSSVKAEGR
jgi:hypothetical protein